MKSQIKIIAWSVIFCVINLFLTCFGALANATPPTFDFDDFCVNESGFPSNVNPPGGTFSFAPDPGDGSMINPTTGEVTNAVSGAIYNIQYTAPGGGGGSTIEQVMVNPIPTYTVLSSMCDPGGTTWTVMFSTDADQIASNYAVSFAGGIYTASNMPLSLNLILTFTLDLTGCAVDVTLNPPTCNCPTIDPPVPGDTAYFCEGSPGPIISATPGAGLVIDWYDAATGGTLLAAATNTYQTTVAGTYYAEARDPTTGCVSDRVPIVVLFVPMVPFNVMDLTCMANGTVEFTVHFIPTLEADSVATSIGSVINNNDGTFLVQNVPWGSSVDITIFFFPSGCNWTNTVVMPTCCHLLDPPISLGDTTVCVGTSPFPVLMVQVGSGYTANWYDQMIGGAPVATSTTSYLPTTPGTYWVSTFDPVTGCESTTRTPISLNVQPPPTFNFITDSCNSVTQLYAFSFSSSTFGLVLSHGTLLNLGGVYEVSDLVGGSNFTMSLISMAGCTFDTTFIIPMCTCPIIDPPISGGDMTFCFGDPLPALTATVPAGFTIDWYDMMIGGTLLGTGTTSFTPTAPGTYYAETRELGSGCISDSRTPIQLTVLPLPDILLDSVICFQSTTYNVYFTTAATIVSSNQGTVSNVVNDHYEISGCIVGTDVLITIESSNGCSIDTLIQSPLCNCPPLAPPISLGDTTICVGAPFPFLEVFVSSGYTVNWYGQAVGGTPLATSSTTFTPLVAGTYYASTVDPGFICESMDRTPVTLTVESPPLFNFISDSCNTANQLYSFSFMTDAALVEPSDGILTVFGATIYQVSDLTSGSSFTLLLTSLNGCEFDTTFMVPNCDCPLIDEAVSSGDQSYCLGETIPALIASVPVGFTIDWYDAANGGTLLLAASLTYTPSAPGIYYAEARDLNTGCTSNLRTAIQLTILPLPNFFIDSIRCSSNLAYDIYVTTNAVVSSNQGFVNDQGNDVFIIQNCVAGTSTLIMLESADGCELDTLIESPNCDCPLIDPPTLSADTFYCEGDAIPFLAAQTNTSFQIDWYDAVVGGNLLMANSVSYQPNGPGTYYAEVYDPLSTCASLRRSVTVDALSPPNFILDSMVCRADQSGYSLYFQTNATFINSSLAVTIVFNGTQYVADSIGSGLNISFGLLDSNDCQLDTMITGLNCSCPIIDPPTLSSDTFYCEGSAIPTLGAQTNTTFQIDWYDAVIGGNLLLANSTTYQPNGPGTYFAEVLDPLSNCSSLRSAVTIDLASPPSFILDSVVCRADLTGYSLFFQSDANLINSDLDVTIIFNGSQYVVDSIGSGMNITLDLTNVDGCQRDTIITGINCDCPIIDPPVSTGNEMYCEGVLAIPLLGVTVESGIRYDWYDAASGGTLISANTASLQLDSAGVVYVEAVDIATGCVSTTRTIIQLTELPLPSFIVDSIRCQQVDYYEIYFSSDGTPVASVGNLQSLGSNVYLVDSIPSSTAIQLTVSAVSCDLDTTIAALVCDCPTIDPPTISSDTMICFGSSLPTLTANTTNGFSINWYDAAVNGTIILQGSTTFTPTTSGTYFAETIDLQSGCVSVLRSSVTVDQLDQIALNLPQDVTTCLLAGAVEVTSNGDDIFWTALDSAILMGNMSSRLDYTLPNFGSYLLEVEASSQGCSTLDTLRIVANELEVNVMITPPTCLDSFGLITLNGTSNTGQYNLIWDNNILTFQGFPYTFQRPTGMHQFTIDNRAGCIQTFDVDIPLVSELFIDLGPDLEGETGQAFTLNIQSNFLPTIYDWNSTDGLFDFNSLAPQIILDENFTYVLMATDSTGCSASDSLTVLLVNPVNVFIPSAFSPNNDGINDRFTIYSNVDPLVEQFQIFNRWGGKMFERTGINLSQMDGWAGYQNEKLAMPGVYIYTAKLLFNNGNSRFYSGELTLTR